MDISAIILSLENAGYSVLGMDGGSIIIEDPSCIVGDISNFIDLSFLIFGTMAAILLFGWGFAMIRGSKLDIKKNIRDLVLLMLSLSLAPVVMRALISEELLQCGTMAISVDGIIELLEVPAELEPAVLITDIPEVTVGVFVDDGSPLRRGTINTERMIDIREVLTNAELAVFQSIIRGHGWRIRNDHAGAGHIGARRRDLAPPRTQHEGIDVVTRPGAGIPALFSGRVTHIGRVFPNGPLGNMVITHDNGNLILYFAYVLPYNVRVGDRVTAGQIVAVQQDLALWPTYRRYNVPTHLHFEIWQSTRRRAGALVNSEALF